MASTRRSRLEQAGLALLGLLTAVGGAVRGLADRAQSDQDGLESDKAKSNSAARAVPLPYESHAQCPPRRGGLITRRWHMSKISRDYQARVTGFAPFTEWKFMNMEFDGFQTTECRLQEAKARYDQFFDKKTGGPKRFFRAFGVQRMLHQASKQSDIAKFNPPTRLTWYFMQPISHRYFSKIFAEKNFSIEPLLYP
ncbi:restriction endonuclease fold toxin 5 domain-containing protein [Trinickia sp.]|uniref:restriction endonuclease fold toxin 5 domain-containing protein n=1 Tax=Trinickia sp. TaxID=2571163 RepID=UPI003F7EA02E